MRQRSDLPKDEEYFRWLVGIVMEDGDDPSLTYWCLLADLHCSLFDHSVGFDMNRAADGRALREEYLSVGPLPPFGWGNSPCSFLEVLIALARRIDETVGDDGDDEARWFWMMVDNLGLIRYNDEAYDSEAEREISEAVRAVNQRSFDELGVGGLFPLPKKPSPPYPSDMRRADLWDQFCAYYALVPL